MAELQHYKGQEAIDENLKPWVFLATNMDCVWISYINEKYNLVDFPWMWERHPKIHCKRDRPTMIPHRYYICHTRDGKPVKGKEIPMDESVYQFAEGSLSRGDIHDTRK